MCFSAQVAADFRIFLRRYPQAKIDFHEFLDLFIRRSQGEALILPKGMTDAFRFSSPQSAVEEECKEIVSTWDAKQVARLHEQLNVQQLRLDGAEAKLASKPTKKAAEDKRIATKRISDLRVKIADLDRSEPRPRDNRIFSKSFCPVLTMDAAGELVVRPQRYLCRPAGMPASIDDELTGNYNARRGSLDKFWRRLFASTRGVVLVEAFFEHVQKHQAEQRALCAGEEPQGVVLKFTPDHAQWLPMACVWSHWTGRGEHDLFSFAIITDEPNPEVLRVGHDRTPISLDENNVLSWLSNIDGAPTAVYDKLLEPTQRPFYDHEVFA